MMVTSSGQSCSCYRVDCKFKWLVCAGVKSTLCKRWRTGVQRLSTHGEDKHSVTCTLVRCAVGEDMVVMAPCLFLSQRFFLLVLSAER